MQLSSGDKQIIQHFFAGAPVKRAFLFGSRARNEAAADSDMDILVELDHTKPIGMKFFSYHTALEQLLHIKVDLISTEGLSEYMQPFIDKDKILIYEREPK